MKIVADECPTAALVRIGESAARWYLLIVETEDQRESITANFDMLARLQRALDFNGEHDDHLIVESKAAPLLAPLLSDI